MVKAFLITTYNRVENLKESLAAIRKCQGSENYLIIIVYHCEVSETAEFIESLTDKCYIKIPINGLKRSGLENMNRNRILGWSYAFDFLQCAFVIAVEDDITLSWDAILFAETIHSAFKLDRRFRGINFGSKEPFNRFVLGHYRKYRYGISGQASLITSRTWQEVCAKKLFTNVKKRGVDSMMEQYFKTGFVIVPRLSRYIDKGWNGTHAPKNKNDDYFIDIKKSWVGFREVPEVIFEEKNFSYRWRLDCLPYEKNFNIYYDLKFLYKNLTHKFLDFIK